MASPTKASAASEQSSVQPSATLIEALHHKLCDPSIVPEFERCRSPHVAQRLITPRWILKDSAAEKLAGADSKAVGGSNSNKHESAQKSDTNNHDNGKETNNNNEPKFNTRPKRNYLDIRTQQNTTFANEQYQRCQKKLAALSSTSPKSVEAINVNKLQIKKVIDSIQNHLNEGLAACPNHEGLVQVELEVRGWLDRLNGVVVVGNGFNNGLASSAVVDTANVAMAGAEERAKNDNAIIDLTQTSPQRAVAKRKGGGEGRAQAAMDDALVEKMFLQGENDNGRDSKNNDDAVGTNQLKWIPPASRVDENADQHMRRKEGASDSDSYHGRRRSRHSHIRRSSRYQSRSRSRSAEREDRRKGERRHRHRRRDDDRKRKKRHHRSRSRSMSRGSVSSAAASLASRSTSRDRSSKRRHRRDRHSRHKRRYKSKSRRKERRKSSKRHRSRRERSRSVSSSSCPSTAGADGIKGRFEPPKQLAQQVVQKETEEGRPVQREDMDGLVPQPNDNGALGERMQSGD